MPNVDGLELLKYLKGNEITKYIPFVFLSFKSDVEQEIRGYELGGDAYISKPFHPKHLLAVVHQILNNRLSLRGLLQFRDLLVGRLRGEYDRRRRQEVHRTACRDHRGEHDRREPVAEFPVRQDVREAA